MVSRSCQSHVEVQERVPAWLRREFERRNSEKCMQTENIKFQTTVQALYTHIHLTTASTPCHVWELCQVSPSRGDLAAIERVAFEFVEDEARNAVLYTEPRFSPHLLVGEGGHVTARQVTEAVLRGLARGEHQFGVTARLLLCCIRTIPGKYRANANGRTLS